MSFDGFSLNAVVKDLHNKINGCRISKIYQSNKHVIYLYLSTHHGTKILSISINPDNTLINLVENTLDRPAEPPVFCMVLRKQLEGGRIASISQVGLDRIVTIDIDTIGPKGIIITKTLICELMGKHSNIILIQDGNIIDVLRKIGEHNNRVRILVPGENYELPPAQEGVSLLTVPIKDFMDKLNSLSDFSLYKGILATGLGFGPVSVVEILYRANLINSKNILICDLKNEQFSNIENILTKLKDDLTNNILSPTLVLSKEKRIKAMAVFDLTSFKDNLDYEIHHYEDITKLCIESDKLQGSYTLDEKSLYLKQVKQEISKAERKLVKINKELNDASKADKLRIMADNITTYMYQFRDRASDDITVQNIYSETVEEISIPLDRRLSLNENAQLYYKKYDKQKRALGNICQQIEKCKENIIYLQSVQDNLIRANCHNDIEAIKQELDEVLNKKKQIKKNRLISSASKPYKFKLPNGMTVLVGKNNQQNDRLSFKIAQKTDFWLHTKDIPGSHVILQTDGEDIDENNLRLLVQIAAYFSAARDSSNVPVDIVPIRYLKKPVGAKPGYVIFTHNRTLIVNPNLDEIRDIIESAL